MTGTVSPPVANSPPALDIHGLSFRHDGDSVLENVNLTVPQGEFLAVIGPNGGGKTTLLRLILGFMQPSSGGIRIFGGNPGQVGAHIGYVPQYSSLEQDFPATVLDVTLMGAARLSLFGGSWNTGRAARQRALEYLDILGLSDVASAPVGSLSGGQRQRVLVTRALMGSPLARDCPFLLLLDEPTASIDPEGRFCFYDFLGGLRDAITIIVVSHDFMLASPFFNAVAFVNKSLTHLSGSDITPENLGRFFGQHLHACPVADFQHASGLVHDSGCTHPACLEITGAPGKIPPSAVRPSLSQAPPVSRTETSEA